LEKPTNYLVEITSKAEQYYWTLLAHLYETHSIERANKKSDDIIKIAMSLKVNPQRGRLEEDLAVYNKEFRALIYHVTKRNSVKIIYFIDEVTKTVYVTDFFPTRKDPDKKTKRS
jgi:hypothetical protein